MFLAMEVALVIEEDALTASIGELIESTVFLGELMHRLYMLSNLAICI